jgi:RNA polymerase sigma factor (sigma-70 family)
MNEATSMSESRWGGVVEHLRRAALRGDVAPADGHLLDCFIARRDEAAFEALVRRHGPMVLGVCRRILRNTHDVEDAFQAAFLVLVRKAASIQPRDLVGNWLYGVAYRTALEARGILARRRAKERQVTAMPDPSTASTNTEPDACAVLDEELNRLPDKYRTAVVLCELEGRSRKRAADLLRIPEGTLSSRLATARRMLAMRLTRRGYGVSATALTALLAEQASATLPAPLVAATAQAAAAFAAGTGAAAVSTNVILVTEGVLKAMFLTKVKTLTAVCVLMAALGGGIGLLGPGTRAGPPEDAKAGQKKSTDPKKFDAPAKVELVQNKDVENKLRSVMAVHYQDISLEMILDNLRTSSHLNIVVDEPAITAAQLNLSQPVNLRLEGVTLKTALKHLLHNSYLGYRVEDGIIIISPQDTDRKMVRRVYNVGDLIGPEGGAENLIRIIRNSVGRRAFWAVRPEDVQTGAGVPDDPPNFEPASIEFFAAGKALVISQTAEMHEEIDKLLMDLMMSKKEQERKK